MDWKVREISRKARLDGVPRQVALDATFKMMLDDNKNYEIEDGTKVKLNVDAIIAEKSYPNKTDRYREFVESSRDVIYTAMFDKKTHMVTLVEHPEWLFFGSDIVEVSDNQS